MTKRKAGKLDSFQSYQRAVKDEAKRSGRKSIYSRAGMFNRYVKAKQAEIKREISKNNGDISHRTAAKIIKLAKEMRVEYPKQKRTSTVITAKYKWDKKDTGQKLKAVDAQRLTHTNTA